MYSPKDKRVNPATGNMWLTNNRTIGVKVNEYPEFPTVELSDDPVYLDGEEEETKYINPNYMVISDDESEFEEEEEESDLEGFEADEKIAKLALQEGAHCHNCLGEIKILYCYFGFYYCSQDCVMSEIRYKI